MNRYLGIALAVAAGMLTGCSSPERRAEAPAAAPPEPSPADAARITQFYTTKALVSRGDTALVCYGVGNATTVWGEAGGRGWGGGRRRGVWERGSVTAGGGGGGAWGTISTGGKTAGAVTIDP